MRLDDCVIRDGTIDDYASLERFHYRAGPPATIARVLCARDARTDERLGVLVVSHPTLNGRWRDIAWPSERPTDKAASATWLNREVRCISRVIVDPRARGRSIATSLVRAYLAHPDTPKTEAIAAMGGACPFFASAGMREVIIARTARDESLARSLVRAGLRAPQCADLSLVRRRLSRSPMLRREVERWARASRATSRWCDRDVSVERLAELVCLGAGGIVCPPRVFVSP